MLKMNFDRLKKNNIFIFVSASLIIILALVIFLENKKDVSRLEKDIEKNLMIILNEKVEYITLRIITNVEITTNAMVASVNSRFDFDQIHNPYYVKYVYEPNNFKFASSLLKTLDIADGLSIYFHPSLYTEKNKVYEIMKLYVVRELGKIIRNTEPWSMEIMNEEWFDVPFKLKKPYWTKPFKFLDKIYITYTYPIMKDNMLFACIAIDIEISKFQNIINSMNFLHTGYAYLLDKNFNIVAHSTTPEFIGKNILDIHSQLHSFVEQVKKEKTGIFKYDYFGNKIVVWKMLSNDYYLVLAINESEIYKELFSINKISIIIMFLFIIITVIVIYLASSIFSKPLFVVEKIINNNKTENIVHITNKYEMGKITKAINKLYDSFSTLILELPEQKIDIKDNLNIFKKISEEFAANLQNILATMYQTSDKTQNLTQLVKQSVYYSKELFLESNVLEDSINDIEPTEETLCFLIQVKSELKQHQNLLEKNLLLLKIIDDESIDLKTNVDQVYIILDNITNQIQNIAKDLYQIKNE